MEGHLEKKGARRIHGWKRLYFSLDRTTGVLTTGSCSADGDAAGVGGAGGQATTTVRITGAQDVQNRRGKRQHRFDFEVADGGAAVCCTAPTAANKTAWLVAANSITSAVAAQNQGSLEEAPASSSSAVVTAPAVSVSVSASVSVSVSDVAVVNTPMHMVV
jgi:hypothetical protein